MMDRQTCRQLSYPRRVNRYTDLRSFLLKINNIYLDIISETPLKYVLIIIYDNNPGRLQQLFSSNIPGESVASSEFSEMSTTDILGLHSGFCGD